MAKVTVETSVCVGCGLCEQLCPEVFKLEDGIAQVKGSKCGQQSLSEVVEQCPVEAIKVD